MKRLFFALAAMLAVFACNKPEVEETPVLEVSTQKIAVNSFGGDRVLGITSNNAWAIQADADWISFSENSGEASTEKQEIKVYVDENTAAEARTAKITVKSGPLEKVVDVEQEAASETPGPGVENQWGMMGCFVDNQWSTDVPMTKEGEWIVAKDAQFTELTFKIRANASWADATNIGRAPGSERAVVNGRIEVVTAEYAKANLGGDAADIKLNGEPGTYDVYFSFENLEVYVMEAGFKPGEKEPQTPDPVEITYTVVGTITENVWSNNAEIGLMAKEGDYLVAKNIPFVWNSTCYGGDYNVIEFKIVETGTWDGFAYPEKNVNQYANAEITVQIGGENIALNAPEGSYDVYFDKANLKVWVMEPGFKPGEKEPLIPEETEPVTEGDIWENDGTVGAAAWSGSPYRFAKEGMDGLGECCAEIPAAVWEGMKIAPFCVNVKPATAETEWWQIRVLDGWWTKNDESGASDINPQSAGLVNIGDGTYTFQVDLASNPELVALIDAQHLLFAGDGFIINKMYFGDLPTSGETPEPEVPGEMEGDGTEANPYILKTAEHMTQMREKAPLGETTWFKMANDIDMVSITNWVPVNYDQGYTRQIHFDGGNYTLSNFAPQTYTNVQEDGTEVTAGYHSLFGILYGSCKNLKIKNVTITATNGCGVIGGYVGTTGLPGLVENVTVTNASITNAGDRAGGICGTAKEATFKNVSFQGTVICTYTEKEARSGGFAGFTETSAVFENCSADVVVVGDSQDLGGFVGKATGEVSFKGCKVKADITSNVAAKNRCGGFIGWNSTVTSDFTDCHVLAGSTITNTTGRSSVSNGNFGGFAGFGDTANTVATFTDCSADVVMDVDDNSTYNGGFIGGTGYASTLTLKGCSAAGVVNGNNYVGGFFGAAQGTTIIEQCSSSVDVTSSGQRSGSFVGVATAAITIRDCYSTGDAVANGQQVGGILGYTGKVASVIERCYATGDITSNTAGTGGILGTSQIAGTKISKCIAWNQNITCNRSDNAKWAPGAVVGASDKNGTFEDCYRRADMNFVDAAGAMVLVDHENVYDALPEAPAYSAEATQCAYHGKASAADATVSSVAKELGWSEDIWDLSGDMPVLK